MSEVSHAPAQPVTARPFRPVWGKAAGFVLVHVAAVTGVAWVGDSHHHDMSAARQGARWWELDLTWLVIRALALVGLVWDLTPPRSDQEPA